MESHQLICRICLFLFFSNFSNIVTWVPHSSRQYFSAIFYYSKSLSSPFISCKVWIVVSMNQFQWNTLDLTLLSKFSFCSQKLYDYLNVVFNLVANFIFTYLLLHPWLYRKYKPIESYEQRCRYKQDFQTQYREYIELKKIVDSVSRKFLELDQVRRKYPEDSEKGQVIFTFLITFN